MTNRLSFACILAMTGCASFAGPSAPPEAGPQPGPGDGAHSDGGQEPDPGLAGLSAYVPAYSPEAPTRQGREALEQKTSDEATAGCNSNIALGLAGAGKVERVALKFHPHGGGYAGCVRVTQRGGPVSPNLAAERYGQGWQWSTRANSGTHNPTQAGTTQWLGAVVDLRQVDGDTVEVLKNRVPLFQNQEFDFVQNESLWQDDFSGDSSRDDDGFDERAAGFSSSADEVLSEFTSSARYKRVPTANGVPAYSVKFYMAYELEPRSLRQFTVAGVKTRTGKTVWDPTSVPAALSSRRSGVPDEATYNNMSNSWGFRLDDTPGFQYRFYCGPDLTMRSIPVSAPGSRTRTYTRILRDLDADPGARLFETLGGGDLRQGESGWAEETGVALQIVSTDGDPSRGTAIGLYVPRSAANRRSVLGYDRSAGSVAYTDNRRLQSMFLVVRDGTTSLQTNLVYRHTLSGLYPPDQDGESLTEMAYSDLVVLFGTPAEIKSAVDSLEAAGGTP